MPMVVQVSHTAPVLVTHTDQDQRQLLLQQQQQQLQSQMTGIEAKRERLRLLREKRKQLEKKLLGSTASSSKVEKSESHSSSTENCESVSPVSSPGGLGPAGPRTNIPRGPPTLRRRGGMIDLLLLRNNPTTSLPWQPGQHTSSAVRATEGGAQDGMFSRVPRRFLIPRPSGRSQVPGSVWVLCAEVRLLCAVGSAATRRGQRFPCQEWLELLPPHVTVG
eukprot:m.332219 g.332219  ORF g.332219 m.332219 type:complete len:220 (-) comp20493_c0_seq17:2418-3077(-)